MSLHIEAQKGDIAEHVLLPGDPLRAKHISNKFFDDPFRYNVIRNMLGYTGQYKDTRVSVQGTGMGMPSISIYAEELVNEYGVKTMIRTGTCGAIVPGIKIGDIILAISSSTDSNMNNIRIPGGNLAPHCSFHLLKVAYDLASEKNLNVTVGGILSSDFFYNESEDSWKKWSKYNVKAIEMETAALYTIGLKYNIECLSILTVSDIIPENIHATSEERESSFLTMAELALDTIALRQNI